MRGGWFCLGGLGGGPNTAFDDEDGMPTDMDSRLSGVDTRDGSGKVTMSLKNSGDGGDSLVPSLMSAPQMRPSGVATPGLLAVLQEFKSMSDGVPFMPTSSIMSVLQHLPVPVVVLDVSAACVSVASTSFGDGRGGDDGRGGGPEACSAFVPQLVYINPAALQLFQVVGHEVFKHMFCEQLARCPVMVEMLLHTSRLKTFSRKRFSAADVWPQLDRQVDVEAASCYLPLQSSGASDYSGLSPGLVLSYAVCSSAVNSCPAARIEHIAHLRGAGDGGTEGGGGGCSGGLSVGAVMSLDSLMVEHTDHLMCLYRLDGSILHQNGASRAYMGAGRGAVLGPSQLAGLEQSSSRLVRPSSLDRSSSHSKGVGKLAVNIASDLGNLFQLDLASLDRLLEALRRKKEWHGTVRLPANGQMLYKAEAAEPPGSWDPESVDNVDIDDVESPAVTSSALAGIIDSVIGRDHVWHDVTAKLVPGILPGQDLILLSHSDVTDTVQCKHVATMKGQHARAGRDTTPSLDPFSEQQQRQQQQPSQQSEHQSPGRSGQQQQQQQQQQAQANFSSCRVPTVEDMALQLQPGGRHFQQQHQQQLQRERSLGYSGFRVPTAEDVALLQYGNQRNLQSHHQQHQHHQDNGPCPRALDPFASPLSLSNATTGAAGGMLAAQYSNTARGGTDCGALAGHYHPYPPRGGGGGDDSGPCPRAFDPFASSANSDRRAHDMFAAAALGGPCPRGYDPFGGPGLGHPFGGGGAVGGPLNADPFGSDSMGPCPRALDPFAGARDGNGAGGNNRVYDPFGAAAVGGLGGLRPSDYGPCPRAFDPFAAAASGSRFAKGDGSQEKMDAFGTRHEQVTVLCADVVGLTSMCKFVPPSTVMTMLNSLYSQFDMLACVFNVHKVETAGNCYMVAGGLMHKDEDGCTFVRNDVDPQHALTVLEFAKVLLSKAGQVVNPMTNEPLQLRVSMHSGPVVSGVIGTMMPHFCLFGETMTTAHRMHATSPPSAIHVSESTRSLLPEERWQSTGGVEIQGSGTCQTYVLVSNGASSGSRSLRDEYLREQYMLQAGIGMDAALSRANPNVRLYM